MSLNALLPERERLAVQLVLVRMYRDLMTDQAIATKVGISQQAVNKARVHAVVGPTVANALYEHLEMSRDEFLAKYATPEEELVLDPKDPKHYAAMVRAIGRSMGLDADNVTAFLTAVSRRGSVPIERVPGALEAFMLTPQALDATDEAARAESRTSPKLPRRPR